MRIDHVAIEIADLDRCIELLEDCGLRVLRSGTRYSTGQRIVMLGDGTGMKLELIEADDGAGADPPVFAHVAFRSGDVAADYERLTAAGWTGRSEPHDLAAARAHTALVGDDGGLAVQVIRYDDDSTDLTTWDQED